MNPYIGGVKRTFCVDMINIVTIFYFCVILWKSGAGDILRTKGTKEV